MAEVSGKTQITIEVTREELFEALFKDLGTYGMLKNSSEGYYKEEDGVLCYYKNISTHGSTDFKCVKKITDERTVKLYEIMMELKKLLY